MLFRSKHTDEETTRPTTFRPLPSLPLAAIAIQDNLVITRAEVTAWFKIDPVPWSYRGVKEREETIREIALTFADLTGKTCHLRGTTRPVPVAQWASSYARNSPNPPNPAALRDHLLATQNHLRGESMDDDEVYLGVPVLTRAGTERLKANVSNAALSKKDLAKARQNASVVADTLFNSPSFHGHPTTQRDLERLMHRSTGLGLPEPLNLPLPDDVPLDHTDMSTFFDSVSVDPRPAKKTIHLRAHSDRFGMDADRFVAVLAQGRTPDYLDIPERNDPWMAYARQLPFPIEWSARFEIVEGAVAAKRVVRKIRAMQENRRGARAAGIEEDSALAPALDRAKAMEDEQRNATALRSTRVRGHWRLAVSGRTEEDVLKRVRQVQRHYARISQVIEYPLAQEALYRSFIPGEPLGPSHYERHMPLATFAAAVPHMSATVGDTKRQGHYLGHTQGISRRAVTWDPHEAMERHDRSGLTAIPAGLGAGKSGLVGSLCFEATLRGVKTTVLDWSGPLAKITTHPDIEAVSEHIDLMRSRAGMLSPYSVIANPVRSAFYDDPDITRQNLEGTDLEAAVTEAYEQEVVSAEKMRQQLALDILLGLLPVNSRIKAEDFVRRAVREVGGRFTTSLISVVETLGKYDHPDAKAAADNLRDMAKWPQCRLFFGSGYMAMEKEPDHNDKVLTVITLAGLVKPQNPDNPDGEQERLFLPLLTAAAYYATRRVYGKPMNERAVFAFDEAHVLRTVPAGRALIDRLARDSRKWNTRVLIASQQPQDFIDLGVQGLLSETFVGRISGDSDPAMLETALRLAGVPKGQGYETTLSRLSPDSLNAGRKIKEFLFTDLNGNHEVIRIDLDHRPDLRDEYLNTTPAQVLDDEDDAFYSDDEIFDPLAGRT